jgi:hypothetical protein
MKTISFEYHFERLWYWSTPYILIGFSKELPFADWELIFRIVILKWSIEFKWDNCYKYYPKYRSTNNCA